MAETTDFEQTLRARMTENQEAYNNGDPSFFNYFAKDAVIFPAGSTEAIHGREAYREYFQPKFEGQKRQFSVLNQSIQVMETRAVVAQVAQIVQNELTANVRQTAIWGETSEGVEIQHLHTALIGSPVANKVPGDASAIRVLNERIATVASVLGVAQ